LNKIVTINKLNPLYYEILAESEFATPTIIKLIPILFSTLGAFTAYNTNFVANPLIFALKNEPRES
jgi:hypothetical protein